MHEGLRSLAIAAVTTALFAGAAFAGTADIIKQRRALMKHNKEMFVPLVKMVKGEMPFDAAVVKKNAETIAADLKKASGMFPEGTDEGDTRAKPDIWLLEDEFQGLFKTAIAKAKALAQVSSADKLAPAVLALGGKGCKACHEKFRLSKKK